MTGAFNRTQAKLRAQLFQLVLSDGGLGIELQRVLVIGDGLVGGAAFEVELTDIRPGAGVRRVHLQGATKRAFCIASKISNFAEHDAEIVF